MSFPPKHRRLQPTALALALLLAGLSVPAGAELARVGPVNPANGYPQWYQDSTGLALDLCLPDAIDLAAGNCLLLPADVASAPETFPNPFADEHFWFAADAALPISGGQATLVLALEAAFAGGPPVAGDQISFGRVRIRFDAPSSGTYTVHHPYGTQVFPDQVAGSKISYTDDVGIACAKGDFSCAMQSPVGPFLRAASTAGGPALPPVTVNGKTMLADPITPTRVTGGPFGNRFRIEGPNIGGAGVHVVETDLFTLMGRVHTAPIPSPLRGERAGYTRTAGGTWVDVFATAAAGIGQPAPNLALSGTGIVPKVMSPGDQGHYWGQTPVTSAAVPSQIQVTNNSDVPPTVIDVAVTDEVTVTEALYDPQAQTLTVKAKSSDEITPPLLTLPAFPGSVVDPVAGAVIPNLAAPPKDVTVRSAAGGADTEPVITRQAAGATLSLPDLSQGGNEDTLMALSLAPAGGGFTPGSFRVLSQPAHGVLTLDTATGNAGYMPATNYEGGDSFTYLVKALDGTDSNVATVTLTVTPVNDAPVANGDAATTTQSQPATLNLLANDVDPDLTTGINPATVLIVTPPAQGGVSVNNGVATYTPGTTTAGVGTFSFSYTVADGAGAVSNPATVTVTVQGIENLSVAAAEFRANQQRWRANGTSSVQAGQTVTVQPRNGATGALGPVIGTAVVGTAGAWALDVRGSSVSANGFDQVQATSPLGGSGVATLRVR